MDKWSYDDDLLSLELYFQEGRRTLSPSHPEVLKLSELIKKKPSSINAKLGNYKALDPLRTGNFSNASKQSIKIWNEFGSDKRKLNRAASRTRRRLQKR